MFTSHPKSPKFVKKCNFQKIVESITQLEKADLPLTESIGIVENIQKMLQKPPGFVAAIA
jgi:hypothetical protein